MHRTSDMCPQRGHNPPLLTLPQNHDLFFHYYCYRCECVYMAKNTHKSFPSIQYCLYIHSVRANHLIFDRQLWGSSLGKTTPTLRIPYFVFCLRVGPHKISAFCLSMTIDAVVLQVLFRQPCR